VVRAIIGIIRMARAPLPASAENWPTGFTNQVQAKMPMTMDGVPFRTSAMNRTRNPSRPEPYSARNRPAPTPIGRPINAAIPTMMPVPTIALATPPPVSPAGTGFFVKNAQSIEDAPLAIRSARMSTSARTAVNDNAATSPVIRPLVMRRRTVRALTAPCSPRPRRVRRAKSGRAPMR
jgi:hypothetical protein